MLIKKFRFQRCKRAVKTAAANTKNPSSMFSLKAAPRALKASTVIAAGGTTFSTKLKKAAVLFPELLRKNSKKGMALQKSITAPIARTKSKASLVLVMAASLRKSLPLNKT